MNQLMNFITNFSENLQNKFLTLLTFSVIFILISISMGRGQKNSQQ